MKTEFKFHSPKITVFNINESPENEYNNIFPVLIIEDSEYFYSSYVFDDPKYEEMQAFIEKKNREYWQNIINNLEKGSSSDANSIIYTFASYKTGGSDFPIPWDMKGKEAFLKRYTRNGRWDMHSEYVGYLEKKGLLRKRTFLESDKHYEEYEKDMLNQHKEMIILDLVDEIVSDKLIEKQFKNPFNKDFPAPNLPENEISKIGFKPLYHSKIALYKLIQHGTVIMLIMSLWFLKYGKLMKWWKIIGSDTEQEIGLGEFLDNNTFLEDVFLRCGWKEEYDTLLYFFNYNWKSGKSLSELEIKVSGDQKSFESFGYVLRCAKEDKLDNVYTAVNEVLKNLFLPNIDILYFEHLLNKKGPTELSRRFDRAKMLRTKY